MSTTSGLICPHCGSDTEVTGTRRGPSRILRYRRCQSRCGYRCTSVERIAGAESISGVYLRDVVQNPTNTNCQADSTTGNDP